MRNPESIRKTTKLLIPLGLAVILTGLIVVVASGATFTPLPERHGREPVVTGFTSKSRQKTIPTTEPVTLSSCAPCHSNIDDFASPALNFKHRGHLAKGIRCSVCHSQFPHQNDQTLKPTMETCFNCHGVNHRNQGVISKDCRLCHPQGRKRSPTHTGNWATSGHKEPAYTQLFSCMMCHTQNQCISCHESKRVKHITLEIPPGPPSPPPIGIKEVRPTAPAAPSDCSPCHINIDTFSNPRILFSHVPAVGKTGHQLHLEKGIACQACHLEFPHLPTGTKRPPMDSCADCHKVAHGKFQQIATGECLKCHPSNFDLTSKPTNHLTIGWSTDHGKKPPDILQKCYSCHDSYSCTQCHKTLVPHLTFWLKDHKETGRTNKADCRICHKEKGYCSNCHHADKKAVTTDICKQCHANFKNSWKQLARKRQRKLALHKAHTAKKWACNKCHVVEKTGLPKFDWFIKGDMRTPKKKKELERIKKERTQCPSSLAICDNKGCHHPDYPGKKRGGKKLVVGNELCRLCHPEK